MRRGGVVGAGHFSSLLQIHANRMFFTTVPSTAAAIQMSQSYACWSPHP